MAQETSYEQILDLHQMNWRHRYGCPECGNGHDQVLFVSTCISETAPQICPEFQDEWWSEGSDFPWWVCHSCKTRWAWPEAYCSSEMNVLRSEKPIGVEQSQRNWDRIKDYKEAVPETL